jgi:hypothetical protein
MDRAELRHQDIRPNDSVSLNANTTVNTGWLRFGRFPVRRAVAGLHGGSDENGSGGDSRP